MLLELPCSLWSERAPTLKIAFTSLEWEGKVTILPDNGHAVVTAFERCSQSSFAVQVEEEGLELCGQEATLVKLYLPQSLASLTRLKSPSNLKVRCWKGIAIIQDYGGTLFGEKKEMRKNLLCHLNPSSYLEVTDP